MNNNVDSIQYEVQTFEYSDDATRRTSRLWKAFHSSPAGRCPAGLFSVASHLQKTCRAPGHLPLKYQPNVNKGRAVRSIGTPIGLRYFIPAPSLRSVVSSYYIFHANLPHYSDVMRADLPQLRFIIRGSALYDFLDGRTMESPRVSLLGPTYGAYRFVATGPLVVLGIGLQPAGWSTLVREDASEYANRVDDAEPIFGEILTRTLDTLEGIDRLGKMAEIADQLIGTLLMRVPEPSFWFTKLTDSWLASSLSPEVDDLVASVGMSSRQVERLSKRIYGAPPKLLARKYRALKAAAQLAKGNMSWAEAAGDAFSDQSHFIREFRQFVGVTPNQLLSRPPLVMRLSLERRRALLSLPELTKIT